MTNLIAAILILLLVVYVQILPHKNRLSSQYSKYFNSIYHYLYPIINKINQLIKPVPLGTGLSFEPAITLLVVTLLVIILM